MHPQLLLVIIALFFAALWLPFGQHPYLYENWMTIGLYGAGFLLIGVLSFWDKPENLLRDLTFLQVLLFVAYLLHQYEEHGTDLLGRHFAFMPGFNAVLAPLVPLCSGLLSCPLNPAAIFAVNTTLVWLVMAIAIWGSSRFPFMGLCAAAIMLVNAITHIAQGILLKEYNSGLLTAVVIFVLLSLFYYKRAIEQGNISRFMIVGSIIWAILAHILIGSLAIGIYVYHLLPQSFYLILLALWSLVPLLWFSRYSSQEITGMPMTQKTSS